jgi:predicted small metal-binding protein
MGHRQRRTLSDSISPTPPAPKGLIVYEFICERVIPGCTHKERGPNREEVHEKAMEHMRDHHKDDNAVEETRDRVIGDAMIFIPR